MASATDDKKVNELQELGLTTAVAELRANGHEDPETGAGMLLGHSLRASGDVPGFCRNERLARRLKELHPWLPQVVAELPRREQARVAAAGFTRYERAVVDPPELNRVLHQRLN